MLANQPHAGHEGTEGAPRDQDHAPHIRDGNGRRGFRGRVQAHRRGDGRRERHLPCATADAAEAALALAVDPSRSATIDDLDTLRRLVSERMVDSTNYADARYTLAMEHEVSAPRADAWSVRGRPRCPGTRLDEPAGGKDPALCAD